MIINEIDIKKFGKLDNLNLKFKKGINLVEGNNESGKSTILQFITSAFFGFYKYKRNGIKEEDLWKPWDETVFYGKLKYSLDSGRSYLIERNFNERNPKIYNSSFKEISDRYLRNKSNMDFLEEQIGIDENVFKNIIIAKQNLMILSDDDKNILIEKIINKTSSGDENVSFNKINKKLSDILRDKIGNSQTKAKPLNNTEKDLLKLYEKKQELENLQREKNKIEKDKKLVQERFSSSSEKLKLINDITKIKNELEKEKEIILALKQNYEKNLNKKNEYLESINEIENYNLNKVDKNIFKEKEKGEDKEKEKKSKKGLKYIYISLAFVISLVIMNLFLKKIKFSGLNLSQYLKKVKTVDYLLISNLSLACIYIILNFICILFDFKKVKKEKEKNTKNEEIIEYQIKENILNSHISFLNNEIKSDKENILKREERLKNTEENSFKSLLRKYGGIVDSKYIKSLILMNLDKLKTEEGMLKQIYEKSMYSLSSLETQKLDLSKKENLSLEIDEEIEKKENEKKELLEYKESINIAQNILNEANEELKKIIDPKFLNDFNKIIKKITNEKYTNINIEEDKEIYAKDNIRDKIINIKFLSAGTIDQFNLAFRLTILLNISDENLPIIFDEAFVNYDNIRLKNILSFFNEISDKRQIILFSSNDRERNIMEKENITFNYINLN